MFAQSPEPSSQDDLITKLGSDITVAIDRWSAGQIGIPEIIIAAAVAAAAAAIAWLGRRLIRRLSQRYEGSAAVAISLGARLFSMAIYLFAAVIILEVLGFGMGPVLILVLIVVVVVLFLRPVIGNLSTGLLLQVTSSFQRGDIVETGGVLGIVKEVTARTVIVLTNDGLTVHIPNSQVVEDTLINYSTVGRRRSTLSLHLSPDSDLQEVTTLVSRLCSELGTVLDDPAPEVVIAGFDGRRSCVDVLFWHEPELSAQRSACNDVARALREDPLVTLADPSFVVDTVAVTD